MALRMVGPDAAEDVAQQAFVRAWRSLDRFAGRAAFETWLYRIVMNLCFDELRRAGRYRPLPLDETTDRLIGDEDVAVVVEEAVEKRARRAALARALEELPTEDRLLLSLRTGEGLSYDRIAELVGMNPRTVGTRLFRARARLHRLVMQYLEEGSDALR
jgi:RNA polymerase sigma-70 factor, ECF subfamily